MIFAALALAAVIQSTTTCQEFAGRTTCRTTPDRPTGWAAYNAAREASDRRREQDPDPVPGARCNPLDFLLTSCAVGQGRQERRNEEAERAVEDQKQILRQTVSRLLAADDCPAAIRTALDGGDMDLAREARDFCRP